MTTTPTTETPTPPLDRTLYGCPSWCTFEIYIEPGDHKRSRDDLAGEYGDSVGLYVHPGEPIEVTVFLGRNGAEHYPAKRETVEHLRDLARMLQRAAGELSGLLQGGEVQA
jgi:hypothetical protein